MPWEIRRNYGGCSGYAVVKLPDGSVSGCHTTRASARAQLGALYASEPEAAQKETVTNQITPNKYPQYIRPKKRKVKKDMDLYDMLNPEEKAYHDALVEIVQEFGYFDQEASGVWVGYESASENEDAVIGVKCGNCSFHVEQEDGNIACKLVSFLVEENAKCRLAAIPDGLVNTNNYEENDMEDFIDNMMEDMGKADSVRVGQMVSWNSSGGRATGKVIRVIRNGKYNVPNSEFTITGTPDNPAVAIRIYRDGKPTDTIVGHKMDTLRTVGKAMNQDIEETKKILEELEKGYKKDKMKAMNEDDEDMEEEMKTKGYKDKKNKSIDSDSAVQLEVPKNLSDIFSNMPKRAKRVNKSVNTNTNLYKG